MDIRAVIVGILAGITAIGAITLAALQRDPVTITTLLGLTGTFAGYVVGLYSSAYDAGPTGVEFEPVDLPASLRLDRESGGADALDIVSLLVVLAWVYVLFQLVAWVIR